MNGRNGVNGISIGAFANSIAVKAIPKGDFANVIAANAIVIAAFVSIVSAIVWRNRGKAIVFAVMGGTIDF